MALPNNRTIGELTVCGHLADISASSNTYLVAPVRGQLVAIQSILEGAISGSDATLSASINGTAVSDLTWTHSSAAAGTVSSVRVPAIGTTRHVNEGDLITVHSDGGSDDSATARINVVIRRGG
jgi:hypothetical protein